jgi:hypothetical protein
MPDSVHCWTWAAPRSGSTLSGPEITVDGDLEGHVSGQLALLATESHRGRCCDVSPLLGAFTDAKICGWLAVVVWETGYTSLSDGTRCRARVGSDDTTTCALVCLASSRTRCLHGDFLTRNAWRRGRFHRSLVRYRGGWSYTFPKLLGKRLFTRMNSSRSSSDVEHIDSTDRITHGTALAAIRAETP